jgi:hypothetical protein
MDSSDVYRLQTLKELHSLLTDEGVLIVGEPMIPSLFAHKQPHSDSILHKWYEIGFGSKFYDKKSFQELVNLTPFSHIEFLQALPPHKHHFWALRK